MVGKKVGLKCLGVLKFALLLVTAVGANEQSREVNVLWVQQDSAGKVKDEGVTALRIRLTKNDAAMARIAFLEGRFDATGRSYKSAGWIASFVAVQEAGKSLNDYEITFVMGDEAIDGPSAGMATSATLLTMIDNVDIKEEVAITGTINPDGSIGPVGAVREKLEGAIKGGIKTFGYPIGSRMSYDPETKSYNDINEIAEKAGVTAVELADINDAYRLLTGKDRKSFEGELTELKTPPELSVITQNQIRSAIASLRLEIDRNLERIEETHQSCLKTSKGSTSQLEAEHRQEGLLQQELMTNALHLERQGLPILAYYELIQLHAHTLYYEKQRRLLHAKLQRPYFKAVIEAIQQYKRTEQQLQSMELAIKGLATQGSIPTRINLMNAEILLCEAKSHFIAGRNCMFSGLRFVLDDKEYDDSSKNPGANPSIGINAINFSSEWFERAALYFSLTEARSMSIRDFMTFSRQDNSPPVTFEEEVLKALASDYSQGASASLAYFRTNNVQRDINLNVLAKLGLNAAGREGESLQDDVYGLVVNRNFPPLRYAAEKSVVAGDAMNEESRYKDVFGRADVEMPDLNRDHEPMGIFGFSAYSYVGLAQLIFIQDVFPPPSPLVEAPTDPAIENDGLNQMGNRKALVRCLDTTRERALRKASIVQAKIGAIPDSISLNLNLADFKRYANDDNQRLQAFAAYWRASLLCDIALSMHQYSKN
ncbi:MAG: hypothetical protein MUF31_01510 [Akkermansiaceae bacterium]|jgi:hypothetical protein|nr:hypothetical protein [Akkermansiaceae bacterium]